MVSAMHKQSAFTAMVTVSAVIGVILWELGLQDKDTKASTVGNGVVNNQRADWSNYFEGALLSSILIACYIRFYASYYAIGKINRALSLGCILLFAAVVVVLVKTAPCGTAYEPYKPCFEVLTGIAFGFALLDLVIFLVWKCLFHYNSAANEGAAVLVKEIDVEAPVEKEVEVKSEAALEKEEEAKKEEEESKAKKEEEAEEEKVEEKAEEKEEEVEQKSEEKAEAEPLLQQEEKKEEVGEEKKE